jgi:predicted nucleotide-binding protein
VDRTAWRRQGGFLHHIAEKTSASNSNLDSQIGKFNLFVRSNQSILASRSEAVVLIERWNEFVTCVGKGGDVTSTTERLLDAIDDAMAVVPSTSGSSAAPAVGQFVFVVHGRDHRARERIFNFLRCLGLRPLEWTQVLMMTGQAAPFIGEVLDAAFRKAAAVVVLLTPDDEARLRDQYLTASDPAHEGELTGQSRPNVLFEAGMAFGRHPKATVLVQVGDARPFSDIAGRHIVRLVNTPQSKQELAQSLRDAGCDVDTTGTDWLTIDVA